jgi:hypothetical protein
MYMQHRRHQHPSGRPIREQIIKRLSFTRTPFDEPLTPGLRKPPIANAIGFTARLAGDPDDEQD